MIILTSKENIQDIVTYKDSNYIIFGPDVLQSVNFFMNIRDSIGWNLKDKKRCDSIRGIETTNDFLIGDCYIFSRPETYSSKSYNIIIEYIRLHPNKIYIFVLMDEPPFKDQDYDGFLKNITSFVQPQ